MSIAKRKTTFEEHEFIKEHSSNVDYVLVYEDLKKNYRLSGLPVEVDLPPYNRSIS